MFDDLTSDNNQKKEDTTQSLSDKPFSVSNTDNAGLSSQKADDLAGGGFSVSSADDSKDKDNGLNISSPEKSAQDMFAGTDTTDSGKIETPASLANSPFSVDNKESDMFSEESVDSYQSAVDSLKSDEFGSDASASDIEVEDSGGFKKVIFIVIAVLFVGAVVFGIYSVFFKKSGQDSQTADEVKTEAKVTKDESKVQEQDTQDTSVESAGETAQEETVVRPPVDSDLDGLPDEEEKKIGTDPFRADTDNDGLFDNEEVNIYKTNPLVKDTDSDGYIDGVEVRGGYNPKGPGKLLILE